MKGIDKEMGDIKFSKSQIIYLQEPSTDAEVLTVMTDLLHQKGYVKDTYQQAILNREKAFPTGLFTGGINVAIPHADVEHVDEASICVGILRKPVKFHAMDEPDNFIDVSLVIMLALKEPHGHIDMLTKVVNLIQNQETVKEITNSNDESIVYSIIKKYLL